MAAILYDLLNESPNIKIEISLANLIEAIDYASKSTVSKNNQPITTDHPEQLLTIQQAAEFLSLSVPTLYSKVSKGELPVMKQGKRLYFSRTELMEYIKEGRKKSNAEIEAEAEAYLTDKKKGLNNGR